MLTGMIKKRFPFSDLHQTLTLKGSTKYEKRFPFWILVALNTENNINIKCIIYQEQHFSHYAWLTPTQTQTHPHVKTWTVRTKTWFCWAEEPQLYWCFNKSLVRWFNCSRFWNLYKSDLCIWLSVEKVTLKETFCRLYWLVSSCKTFSVQLSAVQTCWSCRLCCMEVTSQAQPWNTLNLLLIDVPSVTLT